MGLNCVPEQFTDFLPNRTWFKHNKRRLVRIQLPCTKLFLSTYKNIKNVDNVVSIWTDILYLWLVSSFEFNKRFVKE